MKDLISEGKLIRLNNIQSIGLCIVFVQGFSSLCAWQIKVELELLDTQVQKFSFGIQTNNALMKKLHADKLFFNLNYNKRAGFYCDAKVKELVAESFTKKERLEQLKQALSLALLRQLSFGLRKIYMELEQKNTPNINNLLSINSYNRVAIPFESIVNNVIDDFVVGIVPRSYVTEVYNQVQKSLAHAKSEYLNTSGVRKKLVVSQGKLSFLDQAQELREKINMLEQLAKKLNILLSAKETTV